MLSLFVLVPICALPVHATATEQTFFAVGAGDNISEGDVWDDDDDDITHYSLHVNGEFFSSDKLIIRCGSGTAQFNPESNTLTLNNATLSKTPTKGNFYADSAIGSALSDLTVVFNGKTVYDAGNTDNYFFRSTSSVTFTGNGIVEMVQDGADGKKPADVKIDVNGDIFADNVQLERFVVPTAKKGNLHIQNATLTQCELSVSGEAVLDDVTLDNCKLYAENQLTMNGCTILPSNGLLDGCTKLKSLTIAANQFGGDDDSGWQQSLFGDKYLTQLRIYVPVEEVYRFQQALPAYKSQIFADGPALLGDVDGDGTITVNDATVIQRYAAEYALPIADIIQQRGDVDGDGQITVVDATLIQKYLAEYILSYPVGKPMA